MNQIIKKRIYNNRVNKMKTKSHDMWFPKLMIILNIHVQNKMNIYIYI